MATTASVSNLSVLQGLAKEVYAKLVEDIRVEETYLQENIEFDKRAMEGNFYHQPVALTQNCGQFADGPDGTADMTNFPPVAMQTGDVQLKGFQLADRLRVSYEAISRLENGDSASFINTHGLKMLSVWKSARRNKELSLLYGSKGLAQVTSIPVAASGGVVTVGLDWGLTAPGMWIAAENKTLQAIQPANGTVTYSAASGAQTITVNGQVVSFTATGVNATDAGLAAAAINAFDGTSLQVRAIAGVTGAGVCNLYATDPNLAGASISLSATGTGATASGATFSSGGVRGSGGGKSVQVTTFVDTPSNPSGVPTLKLTDFNSATVAANIAIGDVLFRSPFFSVEPNGIDYWLEKTALGAYVSPNVVANVDSSLYSAFRSTVVNLQGKKMSIARLADVVAAAQDRGLAGDVIALVSPKLYAQLLGEAEGTVNKDYSYKKQKFEGGFEGIELTTFTGEIKLVPHRFVKRAEAFILELDELIQIGSVDLTDKLAGGREVSLQLDAPQGLYSEMRLFANFNLIMKAPSHMVKVKGIGFDA